MTRDTHSTYDPKVMQFFDQYVHGIIDRRQFLQSIGRLALGGLTAAAVLESLTPRFAEAKQVDDQDARISARYVEFDSPNGYGKLRGYLVYPAHAAQHAVEKPLPAVLVVHENRGLNPHIEDIARRLALEGYIAFAPDALTPLGGYPGDEDKARELFSKLDQAKTRQDFIAAFQYLVNISNSSGRVGVIGFCYGGGISSFLATKVPTLGAAVSFYGNAPNLDDVPAIRAPLQLHFAESDERINNAWPAYKTALEKAGVPYTAYQYPGTQHGFNNDTTPRYNQPAANQAWQRSVAFFNEKLSK